MPTPSIQTLRTDAQQVLNLDSISAVRSVVAATLANANAGTPLNPNLTTQQLWNEFYQIVTQPKSDIESIIANQLMKFMYAPPAPGGVGGNQQVIYNDNGVLAGDTKFLWDDALNKLDIDGSAIISGTIQSNSNVRVTKTGSDTFASGPFVYLNSGDSSGNGSALQLNATNGLDIWNSTGGVWSRRMTVDINGNLSLLSDKYLGWGNLDSLIYGSSTSNFIYFRTNATEQVRIDGSGNVDLKNGNVKVSAAKGIDFSATPQPAGMTSELLNDYEEGTFTATVTGGTTNPTTPVTAVSRYTKIGRLVTVQISFSDVNTTGASGDFIITGLPFVNASGFSAQGSVVSYLALTFTGSISSIVGSNSSSINVYGAASNAIWNIATHNAGASRFLSTTITYTVA